jgi:carboxyl-terminal processing protease
VLAIDGEPTEGEELERLTARLAGPEQTGVVLTLRRRGEPPREVEIVRALIPPRTVTAERRGDLLLLRVSGFAADTGARMAQALADAAGNPHRPRGVVIDLRGNRGGLLAQAVAAAEVVIPEGVVATTAGRHPAAAHVFVAHGADLTAGLPVVVLVDGSSASAAEILAAALADQHRAVVVGSATLGKGLVQTIVQLPDGGALLISWSRVLAPLGWPLQGLGVLPQVCTSLGPAALERQLRALAHGAQPMAAALERQRGARPPLAPDEVLAIRAACPAAVGRESDWLAAERLLHDPKAYAAALLGPPPPSAGAANALAVSTP